MFGGFWERLIGITKNAIKKVLGRVLIAFDELSTILTEIEATVNDQPLTYVSSSIEDNVRLTPSHLLNGRSLTQLPYINITDDELYDPDYDSHTKVNKRYEHLVRLHIQFWRRWQTEYLTALRERHPTTGTKNNTIKVGDVVIVHDDINRRVKWQLAIVNSLVYGKDGSLRSAEVKTSNGHS
ncbi:uncharacterized protein LOC144358009 [Saccoglossus kowalevskii]